jgi:hypothetical protein
MGKSCEELLDMAEECKALARVARTNDLRDQLLDIADQFEKLAAGKPEWWHLRNRRAHC